MMDSIIDKMYPNKNVYNSMWSLKKFSGSFIALCGLMGGQNNANKRDFPPVRRKKHIIQSFQLSYWYRNNPEVKNY
ncbi:hypothetical protein BM1374165_00149 [Bartonella henselae]|uniref:Uncharacterized protein n=1 Tax=Bartonella henselae TaxID=38323 RepID=X5MEB0_BARHN|nr:hypothetical protein [Bartonella henselae]MDM9996470.1 hypothetical protein [Bartonella henselae]CDO46174.1 hypothetical protein BM1374165_00149 [Bartonella henselae]